MLTSTVSETGRPVPVSKIFTLLGGTEKKTLFWEELENIILGGTRKKTLFFGDLEKKSSFLEA